MMRLAKSGHLQAWVACLLAGSALAGQPLEVPFFHQEKNGCGAASVAMLMHYWNPVAAPSPQGVYRQLYDAPRQGILLASMKQYLEEHGFQAFTLRGQWGDVTGHLAKGRPIIVALRKKRDGRMHFAVLTGTEGSRVWMNDPTRSKSNRVKQIDFEKQWDLADRWMLISTPPPKE